MRLITLITLGLALGCSGKTENAVSSPGEDGSVGEGGEEGVPGEAGEDGEDGEAGADGEDGSDGVPCWDLDGDGEPDPEEDTNGDGVVDVDDCRGDEDETGGGSGGIFLGDLTIRSEEQALYFCDHYDTVLGNLEIYTWGPDFTALSCLKEVSLNLRTDGRYNDILTAQDLPSLETVGGQLTMTGNYVSSASLPALERVGLLHFDQLGWAGTTPFDVSFPTLIEAGLPGDTEGSVWIYSSGMATLDFGSLETVNGGFQIGGNESLLNLDGFGALDTVTGDFSITNNDLLCEDFAIDLAEAVDIGGEVRTGGNTGSCP
jgi:hypothetical protein